MGLDLKPFAKPNPGFEKEFMAFVERRKADHQFSDEEVERFQSNTISPYESLGAPIVGRDAPANAWAVKSSRERGDKRDEQQILAELNGYHALELLEGCDGVPSFSSGGLYDGVDRTSLRGEFLKSCTSYLDISSINRAWTPLTSPAEAVAYGDELLSALARGPQEPKKPGFFGRVFGSKRHELSPEEQAEILLAAGKWYRFWGGRGHYIEAWF